MLKTEVKAKNEAKIFQLRAHYMRKYAYLDILRAKFGVRIIRGSV